MEYSGLTYTKDYLLIDPEAVLVEHYHRLKHDEWLLQGYSQMSDIPHLESLGIQIGLSDIY